MYRRKLSWFVVVATLSAGAWAGDGGKVRTIAGIAWHDTLPGAMRKAAPAERRKARPVLLLRMLGDLAGKT